MIDEVISGELLNVEPRRQGVIVGVPVGLSKERLAAIRDLLIERFPGVTFAVVAGADSIAFDLP
jgi:hypothetical protein